ncbi:two pore domain potassium channel family protein [Candidatus Woesearchaeota archaeon]|nr:two pore domain potassium channel family protein [Candidatus Woesearchaeota archaeon]
MWKLKPIKIFDRFTTGTFNPWFDSLTFPNIFLLWTSIIVVFGLAYYFFTGAHSFLYSNPEGEIVTDIWNNIYFSFVTATTTGFGDLIPFGYFKAISIIEVIFGLLLLAIVTSKLVSIKQNIILTEIYDISFNEQIRRLRSSLFVFKQNLNKIINKIEDGAINKREISELYVYLSPLEDILHEIITLLEKPGKYQNSRFTKVVDPLNTELIFNSVIHSFEKLHELVLLMNEKQFSWKMGSTIQVITRCIDLNKTLFEQLRASKSLKGRIVHDLATQNEQLVNGIKKNVETSETGLSS